MPCLVVKRKSSGQVENINKLRKTKKHNKYGMFLSHKWKFQRRYQGGNLKNSIKGKYDLLCYDSDRLTLLNKMLSNSWGFLGICVTQMENTFLDWERERRISLLFLQKKNWLKCLNGYNYLILESNVERDVEGKEAIAVWCVADSEQFSTSLSLFSSKIIYKLTLVNHAFNLGFSLKINNFPSLLHISFLTLILMPFFLYLKMVFPHTMYPDNIFLSPVSFQFIPTSPLIQTTPIMSFIRKETAI